MNAKFVSKFAARRESVRLQLGEIAPFESACIFADEVLLGCEFEFAYAAHPAAWARDVRMAGEWLILVPGGKLRGSYWPHSCGGDLLMAPVQAYQSMLAEIRHAPGLNVPPLTARVAAELIGMTAPSCIPDLTSIDALTVLTSWPETDQSQLIAEVHNLIHQWSASDAPVEARCPDDNDSVQTLVIDLVDDWEEGNVPNRSVEWRPLARTPSGWALHIEPGLILSFAKRQT